MAIYLTWEEFYKFGGMHSLPGYEHCSEKLSNFSNSRNSLVAILVDDELLYYRLDICNLSCTKFYGETGNWISHRGLKN